MGRQAGTADGSQGMSRGWRFAIVAVAAALALEAPASADHNQTHLVSAGGTNTGTTGATFVGASSDGSRAFFETGDRLVAGDSDSSWDVYERSDAGTRLISIGALGTDGGNGPYAAFFKRASADGSRVIFETGEQLVPEDDDTRTDVYERVGSTTRKLSLGNGAFDAFFRGASGNAEVVYYSTAEPLLSSDTDAKSDIYQAVLGSTFHISNAGSDGAFDATFKGTSSDGAVVWFETAEQLLAGDTDTVKDVYERRGGTTLVSTAAGSGNGPQEASFQGASADGSRVLFSTREPLVGTDGDTSLDIYERAAGATQLMSDGTAGGNGPFEARFRGNSTTGNVIFFETAENLVTGDTDGRNDVYGASPSTTVLLSVGSSGSHQAHDAYFRGASADGTRAFFETTEALLGSDADTRVDVYERGNLLTTTSLRSTGNGAFAASFRGSSRDGVRVFYETREQLTDDDGDASLDVYESSGTRTTLLSTGPRGGSAAQDAEHAGQSDDGRRVFFETLEALTEPDLDGGAKDVYVRATGTLPGTTLTRQPAALTRDRGPAFEFASGFAGARFECRIDGALYGDCTSPHVEQGLADGSHRFEVRAKDASGNSDPTPAVAEFVVDATPPETRIDSGPAAETSERSATFSFSGSEGGVGFECKFDDGSFAPCSSPHTTGDLSDGAHRFEVVATDAAGNRDPSPAAREFSVVAASTDAAQDGDASSSGEQTREGADDQIVTEDDRFFDQLDRTAPALSGRVVAGQKLARVLKKGLVTRWRFSEAVTGTLRATLTPRAARKLGLKRRSVAKAFVEADAGAYKLKLRFARKVAKRLARARALALTVELKVVDRAGHRAKLKLKTTLRKKGGRRG